MLKKTWLVSLALVVLICAVGLFVWWQQQRRPLPPKVTIEDLWEHPGAYVGMVVEIRGQITVRWRMTMILIVICTLSAMKQVACSSFGSLRG